MPHSTDTTKKQNTGIRLAYHAYQYILCT